MTNLCNGGTSSNQAAYGLGVAITVPQIAALFNNVPTQLAVAAAGAIGLLNFELSTFCASDPPPMPNLVAQDYVDLLNNTDVAAQLTAVNKFRDWFGAHLWCTFCKCDNGVIPQCPALPGPPANIPVVQPPALVSAPVGGTPCWNTTQQCGWVTAAAGWNKALLQWSPETVGNDDTELWNLLPQPIPTRIVITVTSDGSGPKPSSPGWFGHVFYRDSGANVLSHYDSPEVPSPGTYTWDTIPPAGAYDMGFQLVSSESQTPASDKLTITETMYCAGQSASTPQTPCCPPDPSLQAQLNAILSYLQALYNARQLPLASYVLGPVHGDLTGSGTITLENECIAIRCTIIVDSTHLGSESGDPTYLFDRGFVVPIINQGPVRQESRLVYNNQVFMLPPLTEQIGYSFAPNIYVDIQEILAGY